MNCTIYKSIYKFKEPHRVSVEKTLERIKQGTSKLIIEKLRAEKDNEKQDALKKQLPAIVYAGVFNARRDDAIIEHSGYMILDFDYISDVEKKKAELIKHEFVKACWISPRGNGVKALILLADPNRYREHFLAIEKIFPDVDPSGKNISRACFESYDTEILINENVKPFTRLIEEFEEMQSISGSVESSEVYDKLKVWLNNKSEAFASGNRNNYIYKLAGALCRYGMDRNTAESHIKIEFSTSDFSQKELENTIKSAYRSNQFGVAEFTKDRLVTRQTESEVDVKDLDEGFEEFSHVIFAQNVSNQAISIYENGYEKVDGINAPVLDYHFKMKRNEITLMGGYANMGKSTMILWILLNRAVLYGEKFAIYSPESTPAEEFYLELVEMLAGCDCSALNPNKPNKELFLDYYHFVGEHFFFVYPEKVKPDTTAIKEAFLELIIKHNVSGVLVDPFNQIYHDRGKIVREDFYLEETLSDFTRFAQQNNVFFLIVAHPTAQIDRDGKDFKAPDMYRFSGGAMWANKMHNILMYHRPFSRSEPDSPLFEFTSEKIKKKKIVGKTGTFEAHFNLQERRFKLPYFDFETKEFDIDRLYDPLEVNLKTKQLFGKVRHSILPNMDLEDVF